MGDPHHHHVLPPGCRFFPSDEHLLSIYLTQKHKPVPSNSSIANYIRELNLYDYEPFNLPDSISYRFGKGGRKRHYYCYVGRGRDEERRRGGGGFWKRSGRVRDVVFGKGDAVVGTRRGFVFYLGDFGNGSGVVRTDWFMYEYALVDPNLASFVLCRVFVRSRKSKTNTSDRPLSSCAQESVVKVRHVGIQHDGTVDLVPRESNILGRNSPDRNNQVLRYPVELARGSDNVVTGWPVDLQLGSYGHTSARGMMVDDPLTAEQLTAIYEDDYLELDDLLSPFPGID
ncbi:NAC domain-containing protein [Heracleum sosnowskyi]|uniref:NAC domain-containing protein n=1 Tax=Heracleum sosnowskyi TaxID=360622 RepID=A0AAD8HVR0_9APIA|nr:NAC domain-containing protein [Heracleum sosnowskyi]